MYSQKQRAQVGNRFSSQLFAPFDRERQEGITEVQPTVPEAPPELPAGLLGLEITPEVRNALKVKHNIIIIIIICIINSYHPLLWMAQT